MYKDNGKMNILKLPKYDEVTEINIDDTTIKLISITDENRDEIVRTVMMMYADEPCRICGDIIQPKDLDELVYAGHSENNISRAAHGDCWKKHIPKKNWAYPEDD